MLSQPLIACSHGVFVKVMRKLYKVYKNLKACKPLIKLVLKSISIILFNWPHQPLGLQGRIFLILLKSVFAFSKVGSYAMSLVAVIYYEVLSGFQLKEFAGFFFFFFQFPCMTTVVSICGSCMF